MTITGKKVFQAIYILNLLFHCVFLTYQFRQTGNVEPNYLLVTIMSVISTTVILISIKHTEKS
ncbi:hypothetical protein [Streptococcus sp. sy010]|uniref:hypothetical protein n=1 Tax=Streptococcus sp. sy010 TaxID=2600148 RepID=UPI0011B6E5CF|nr:hypothetical protein [Streptococcus sp. sy010]TWT16293.1 hypothetical protein FRX51_03130 [Streptococcus sp. sy010]